MGSRRDTPVFDRMVKDNPAAAHAMTVKRYACPLCAAPCDSLAAKKHHMKVSHRPKGESRSND